MWSLGLAACDYANEMQPPAPLVATPVAQVRRARKIYRNLCELYPQAHCELRFRNPFELLVATVLSAQTTDIRVNSITGQLFAEFPGPAALAAAPRERLEELLRPVGFFRAKTQSLLSLAQALERDFAGEVPASLPELITLAGVGRKTANVVLGNAFGVPGLTVDTHFGRLARRFGWTSHSDPVRVEADVQALFPSRDWTMLSHVLIFHGRRTCHARNPACGACPVAQWCPAYGTGETAPERARLRLRYERASEHQT